MDIFKVISYLFLQCTLCNQAVTELCFCVNGTLTNDVPLTNRARTSKSVDTWRQYRSY